MKCIVRVDVPRSLFVHESPHGYFYRIGSSKRKMAPDFLARLFQQRNQTRMICFDEQIVASADADTFPEHTHNAIELCFCSRGSLVFECEGQTHTLLPDNVFLTQPGVRHHLVTNHKGMRMYWLFYKYPRKGKTVLGLSRRETDALNRRLRAITAHPFAVDHSMRQHFRDIFKTYETQDRGPFRTLILRTLLLKILLEVISSSENQPTLKALAKISNIAKIIKKRPAHRFNIDEMAAHAKLSTSRFTALFRQVIGLPPYAYLTTCRLERAKELLAATDSSVSEIARTLGFASPQHLATQFRKTYGLTASAWRSKTATRSRPCSG